MNRSKKGIKVKGIAIKESKPFIKKIFENLSHTSIRYLDEFIPTGLIIYKDKVITLDWGDIPIVFVIQSESVSNSYKKFFKQKWKSSTS